MTIFKKSPIVTKTMMAGALAATAAVSASPAMARDHYRDNDNTAAVAIGAGVVGLALGAILASNSNDRYYDDGYYDDGYYVRSGYAYGPAYTRGWVLRNGYYWDGDGRRHSREEWARYQRAPQRGDYRHDTRGNYGRGDYAHGGSGRGDYGRGGHNDRAERGHGGSDRGDRGGENGHGGPRGR